MAFHKALAEVAAVLQTNLIRDFRNRREGAKRNPKTRVFERFLRFKVAKLEKSEGAEWRRTTSCRTNLTVPDAKREKFTD
ncbi:unnamed protein product [Lasius platythorax]|uniref:Uncharacterized protein n=1 Tax=Lasius platythorax TaxID=488582 RepID=A0AAV2P2G2_9HYME